MDQETITFLRAICAKVKEIASICDAYLENEAKKAKKVTPPPSDDPEHPGNRLIPLTKWTDFHDWPTAGSLRSMIFSSHKTGADYFIRRAGRRLLISEKAFFEWVNMSEEQRAQNSQDIKRFQAKFGKRFG